METAWLDHWEKSASGSWKWAWSRPAGHDVEEAGRRVVHEPVEGVLALGGLVHEREDPLLEHLAVLDGVRPRLELVGAAEQRCKLRLGRLWGSHAG